jgi:hypothetical protein
MALARYADSYHKLIMLLSDSRSALDPHPEKPLLYSSPLILERRRRLLREAYDEFNQHVRYRTDTNTLSGVLDRTISINRRNFRVRNYTKAVVAIYFGPNTPKDVWETLRDMSVSSTHAWLTVMEARGELRPWVNATHFATTMANVQYSVINDWCLGRLSDDEYLPRLVESMLLLLIGAVQGNVRDEAERFLVDIRRTGDVPKFPNAAWAGRADDGQPLP